MTSVFLHLVKTAISEDRVAYTCNPGTWEVWAGGSGVQGHSLLHNEFKACLRDPILKKVK